MYELEASPIEAPKFSELWREEPWSRISSNQPYTIEKSDVAGDAARNQAKAVFIDTDEVEPKLDFPQLDIVDIASALTRFDTMLAELKVDREAQPLLFESITRKHAELSRHRYVLEAQQADDPSEKARLQGYAERLSIELFGDVEPEVFNGILVDLKRKAGQSDNQYAKELLDMLPATDELLQAPERYTLSPETIAKLGPIIEDIFKPALDTLAGLGDGEIEHEDSVMLLQKMIDSLGLDGVRAVLGMGNALDADSSSLTLKLGHNRAKLTNRSLRNVGVHEITHLMGAWRGKQQEDDLMTVGLPNILAFEEGKCVVMEQVLNAVANKDRGAQYYTALGLLRGTLDGRKRNFREVYEVMWRRQLVNQDKYDDNAVAKAKASAYQTTMRVTRGLATDTRDLSYFVGNARASEWFNKLAELPAEEARQLMYLTLATKADPTNEGHLAYLRQNSDDWRLALEAAGI